MKKLLLHFALFLAGATTGWSQNEYLWSSPINPDYAPSSFQSDVIMHNGKLFHIFDSSGYLLEVAEYNPSYGSFKTIDNIATPSQVVRMEAERFNDFIYIAEQNVNDELTMYMYDIYAGTLTQQGGVLTLTNPATNWEMGMCQTNGMFYILRVENYTDIWITEYSTATNDWSSNQEYTTVLNPTGESIELEQLELYLSIGNIYAGVSSSDVNRLGVASIGNIGNIQPYNSAGSNDAHIYADGALANSSYSYFLTGDGQNPPFVNVRDNFTARMWEVPFTNGDINVTTATDPPLDFLTTQDYGMFPDPAYAFLVSNYTPAGSGAAPDRFYLYGRDMSAGTWDSIGPKIEFNYPSVNAHSIKLSLDNNGQHMAVQYSSAASANTNIIKVLDRKPSVEPASIVTNSGLCLGHHNEIYPQLEFYDYDNDTVWITNVTSSTGVITNLSWSGGGVGGSVPTISKFRIYGTINSSGSDQIIVEYTDGWSIFTEVLPAISTSASAPSVTFASSPLVLCNNENMIDLSGMVSYFDNGVFTLNGHELTSPVINGPEVSVTDPSGTIYYTTPVAGCYVETGVTYSFANVGTATTIATPGTCGNTDGTAQVVFTPGTSLVYTVEWSTGETATAIANLAPGAYYYAVTDEYNCHTIGMATVDMTGISVTPTITDVSCYGANDGSISVSVTGSSNYQLLWSNGYSTSSITDLKPGNYEVTVFDVSGCNAVYSFEVTQPSPISAGFTSLEPGCGLSDGNIYGVYSGGAGGYTFNWSGQTQTTADLYNVGHGYYEVTVTDANSCSSVFGYQLDDFQAPDIHDSIRPTSCEIANGAIFVDFTLDPNGGTLPNAVWWSNGPMTANNFNLAAGTYTITVVSGPNGFNQPCYAEKTITVGTMQPVKQEICMLTVNTTTTTNLVVWEKAENSGIDYYNIYRENAVAGNFMLIDTVDFDSESLFNDVVASPADRSWRYRISAVNLCGVESAVSAPHKTMHMNMIVDQGNAWNDIYWDDYEGIAGVEYLVWRYADQNGWEVLASIPFGISAYTDIAGAALTNVDYYVEMELTFQCTAQRAQDFNSARSNKDKGQFSAGDGTGDSNNSLTEHVNNGIVEVFPNPFSDKLTIRISDATEAVEVTVFSISGQQQQSGMFANGTSVLDLSELAPGVYLIQLGNAEHVKRMVKL